MRRRGQQEFFFCMADAWARFPCHPNPREGRVGQEGVAEKADISRRYLQQIEAGKMNPTVIVASRLQTGLKCSWDQLFYKL